ncbi:MAG: hemolysin family protein [Lachnospiraceae bacterium]|nr:hemolysin family protein [Lachnospiraceae bacterium]
MSTATFIAIAITGLILGVVIGYIICYLSNKNQIAGADEDVILSKVNESSEKGTIEESEATMINNIFEFGDKVAKDIMTDRSNIVAIDENTKLDDAIEMMLDAGKSRFPVYSENIDHIIGTIQIKDAFTADRDRTNKKKPVGKIDGLLREAKFIPETRNVGALFASMRKIKNQMVIVIDEYGQTSGIVSMRDILEEIVGDIDDENDDNDFIVAKEENKLVIDGLTPLEDLEGMLDIRFDDENFETINGFLVSKLEHIPDKRERFEYLFKGYNFKVLSVENNVIKQILVTQAVNEENERSSAEENE